MRSIRFDRLLAGSMFALAAAAASTSAQSGPNILQAEPPPPLMLRSQPNRDAAPARPTAPSTVQQHMSPDPLLSRAQAIPAATPKAADNNDNGIVKNTIDRVFGASDAQISDSLRDLAAGKRLDNTIPRQPDRAAAETFSKSRG